MALTQKHIRHPERLEKYLSRIHQSAERASDLVYQILTFSHKSTPKKEILQFSDEIEDAIKMLRSIIPSVINLNFYAKSQGLVRANQTQLHQIVINLATNAYQVMKETGGDLEVSTRDTSAIKLDSASHKSKTKFRYAVLTVRDSGPGMDKETQKRIFDPYFTTKDKGEGTGLGLSVVRGIVESHGGTIEVLSEVGEGTVFKVYLPLLQHGRPKLSEGNAKVEYELQFGNESIMIVDDEKDIVEISASLLRECGYRIHPFTNPTTACEFFENHLNDIDLVITDMNMPDLSGIELFNKITQLCPGMPVVLFTGYSDQIDRNRAMSTGFSGFCRKPLTTINLASIVRKILDESPKKNMEMNNEC